MKLSFISASIPDSGVLVVCVDGNKTFDTFTQSIDDKMAGALRRAVDGKSFSDKKGSMISIHAPHGLGVAQVIAVCYGNSTPTPLSMTEFGGTLAGALATCQEKTVTIYLSTSEDFDFDENKAAAYILDGFHLKSWRFDKYRTKEKKDKKSAVKTVHMIAADVKEAETAYKPLNKVSEGIFLTRLVVSEPPNVLYPKTMADMAETLSELGVAVTVLDEKEMKKLGMNALLGVGQGSEKDSRLVVLEWKGGEKDESPIAFVGKGVTFDTGGISIKPSADMDEMKWDMGGSGVVLGLMKALAGRKAKVNVVGVLGMVENMPDGNAQRPGDIVTSMSGQTIEILNTDAEGRLVLADALWYTQDKYKPKAMVDIATLTGAIIIALGHEYAGLFSNNDDLAKKLLQSSEISGEKLWRLPLADAYDKDIDSTVADVKNIGSGRGAGSITAAQFLQRFVNNVPWAHLDIAAVAWDKKGRALSDKGATAFGVRLLNQFVMDHYESN